MSDTQNDQTGQGQDAPDEAAIEANRPGRRGTRGGRGDVGAVGGETTSGGVEMVETQEPAVSGRVETCNECNTSQNINVAPEYEGLPAAQWTCGRCGAVNTVRYFDRTEGGVERQIQRSQLEESILADEDQARRVHGDETVDGVLKDREEAAQRRQEAEEAAQAAQTSQEGSEADDEEDEED